MKVAYLDCFSGVSGDMLLGALIDAGASPAWIRKAAGSVVGGFRLSARPDSRSHLGGVNVKVSFSKKGQPERHLSDIKKMIDKSGLPAGVIKKSVEVFELLARAEARVHRTTPEKIHFHEVGAIDAIVDVVGTVVGFDKLGVEKIICSPLPLCGGEVKCAHGKLPLPAPAVLELLKGLPVKGVDGDSELVTPTGAALAVALASAFGPMPAMTIQAVGAGLGDRETPGRPNLMRIVVGEVVGSADEAVQLEALIDDMPAEHFDFLMDRLHDAGALEVVFVPAQAKKNRPAVLVRALAATDSSDGVRDALFAHSTTLGVREYKVTRSVLSRSSVKVKTRFGMLTVKKAARPDGTERWHVEYDEMKKAAEKSGESLETIEREALGVMLGSKKKR